jgi:tetratricopeptide (TPR) repeat protein
MRGCLRRSLCYLVAVNWLLILILAALAEPTAPAPESSPAPPAASPSPSTPEPPEDPLYEELRKVLELDEAAQDEVDQWIRAEQQFRAAGGGIGDATLRARVLQRLQPVRQAYEDFVFLHPKHVPARIAFGSFLNDINDESGARDQWEKARDLEPDNPAIWNNLANLYGHSGPIAKAFEHYEKAIALDSQEPTYYQNLATTVFLYRKDAMEYYRCDEPAVFDRSLELYRKAIALKPDDFVLASDYAISFYGIKPPQSLSPDARAQAQDKLNQQAIAAWEDALKIAGDDVQREGVYIHLARIKINAHRFTEARAHLDAISHPDYSDIKGLLTRNLEQKKAELESTR